MGNRNLLNDEDLRQVSGGIIEPRVYIDNSTDLGTKNAITEYLVKDQNGNVVAKFSKLAEAFEFARENGLIG